MNVKKLLARLAAAFVAAVTLNAAAAAPPGQIAGVTAIGERGIRQSVDEIMARERLAEATRGLKPPRLMPEHEVEFLKDRPQNPESREDPFTGLGRNLVPDFQRDSGPYTPQVVGTSFLGATLADTGAFPPDTMGAVGPTQFFVFVNGRLRTFNKTTGLADGVINANPDTFFSSVMTPPPPPAGGNFTSDPQVRYDRLTGRWFLAIIDVPYKINPGDTANRLLLAVSDGANNGTLSGSTVWTFYFVQQNTVGGVSTGDFLDYESLGVDANALYVGGNMFKVTTSAFHETDGFVINKASVMSGGPLTVTAFRALGTASAEGPYAPRGVDNFDPAATEGYFIGVSTLQFGALDVRRVSNPGGVPTISANILVTVSTTTYPESVPHLGNTGSTNGLLDALDDRLFAAHIRNGRLWTAHNIEVNSSGIASTSGSRDGVRWYELQNLTGTPTVAQSGTIFDPAATNPKYYWIPSVMVSGQGHAAFGFSSAGLADRINAVTVGRLVSDALGSVETPVTYTASSTAYNPSADPGGPRRWGDYSFTSLDPTDDMTMWTIQEFCNAANSYGVQIVKLGAPPPAAPASASPTTVNTGQSSVLVTITGTSASGSGFFNTPASGVVPTPNHIAATVTGGVTVNSVTFTDATHVTLDLNTSAASTGAQDVTITNPDGQSATGTGILTVAGNTADLSLTKSDSPDPVVAGSNLTYTLTLTNNGPVAAQNVAVTDPLPSVTTFVSLSAPAGWTSTTPAVGAGGTVTLSNASLANGAIATFTLVVKTKSSIGNGALIINQATASSTTSDPASGNNLASSTTTAQTRADLQVTKSGPASPIVPGQDLSYTVSIKNAGPSNAKNVSVVDPVPTNTTFVSAAAPAGWTTSAPAAGGTGNVTFTIGTLIRGATATFTVVDKVNAGARDGLVISNMATGSAETSDVKPSNNNAISSATVQSQADMAVTVTDSPDPVHAGQNLTYAVKVTNNGPGAPGNLTLTDTLPANTTFVSNSGATSWSCTNPAVGSSGTITCTAVTLAAGVSRTFTIVVKVDAAAADGSSIGNTATISTPTADPTPGNNSGSSTTGVQNP